MEKEESQFEGYLPDDPGWLKAISPFEQEEQEHCQPLPTFDPYEYDTERMTESEMEHYETEAERYEQAGHMQRKDGVSHAKKSNSMWGPRKKAMQGRKSNATGPKGVLTDYEEHKLQLRAEELAKGFQKLRVAKRMGVGAKHYGHAVEEKKIQKGKRPKQSDDEDDSSDDFSDEGLMLAYKNEKLLIANAERPRFGVMRELTYLNFDEEIDGEDPNVYILILFYQDYIPECSLMESILQNLARFYPYIKFMKARTDKIMPDYKDENLPAMLVYKDKKQVWTEVRVTNHLPPVFNDDDVVQLLTDANILQQGKEWVAPSKEEFAGAYRNAMHSKENTSNDPEEDSDSFDL